MGGGPRPRQACVSCVFGARAGCAPSASAPPAPEAELLPPCPAPRRASRATMGQEEELLRIAKKLEKMVARKNTVRVQSSGHSPRPRRRGACEPASPGGACWPGAREARAGLRGPREARRVQGSAPLGDCWAPRGGRVHGPGRRGDRAGPEDPLGARPSGLVEFGDRWVACAGPGKASEETGTWTSCVQSPGSGGDGGRGEGRRGEQNPGRPGKGQRNLS